jgi:hypothetical protein
MAEATSTPRSRAVIKLCPNCKPHPFQDERYGKNMRVMSTMKEGQNRCTVCSSVNGANSMSKRK